MPAPMSVREFVAETRDDLTSPTASAFVSRMPQCRATVSALEESLDFDRDGLTKMKKAVKAISNGAHAHTVNELYLSKALERLGANAMTKDQEPDIGAAFIKFAIVTKELSALMKTQMQNLNNIVMFPLDSLLKGELRGVKGDVRRPVDKAGKEYETKFAKIEKEKKAQAKEVGLVRTEISSAEIAEEMDRERKQFQLQMCEYLLKVNEIKSKKGVELLEHLVEYYNVQTNYFRDGLKTIEHFSGYVNELTDKLQTLRQKKEDERRNLVELRALLRSSPVFLDGSGAAATTAKDLSGYSLHQMRGNKLFGYSKAGHLLKKSEGKMRVKMWQKRKCEVRDGCLFIYHSDEAKAPTDVNLLTCQIKAVPDDRKAFDLISYNRTYHFQTEDEAETEAWTSVLINCKEGALKKQLDDANTCSTAAAANDLHALTNQSLRALQQSVIAHILQLPANDRCVDCNSAADPTWLSTNFGVLTCIECSGIHREMGVHVSRIQSLTLDNIGTSQLLLARVMSNAAFNDIMEGTLQQARKPTPASGMDVRNEFIRAKYMERKYVIKTCSDDNDLKADLEHAVLSRHLMQLLQAFAEGADLTWVLPSSDNDETGLHYAVAQEDGSALHIVDFLAQNSINLNSVTKEGNTALHLSVMYNQSECMKLLLRSGALHNVRNNDKKTALDMAVDTSNHYLIELLECAQQNKKTLFENVNIDWHTLPDEPSTDFSDEDFTDERTPNQLKAIDRLQRSRPSSVVGNDSPSIKHRKVMQSRGSVKKRSPKDEDSHDGHRLQRNAFLPIKHHFRHNSIGAVPHFADGQTSGHTYLTLETPKCRPPPATPDANRLSNGQSLESLPSLSSDECVATRLPHSVPVPPPRKRQEAGFRNRRCLALYDCEADREDELAFREGEIIVVTNEVTDDDEWMEGAIDAEPERRGVFPVSFVQFL